MKATATLATTWPPTMAVTIRARPASPAAHPITRSGRDLESAIANLLETAKAHAHSIGRLPEQDAVANAFRQEHGPLAALIADPIQQALITATDTLSQPRDTPSRSVFNPAPPSMMAAPR